MSEQLFRLRFKFYFCDPKVGRDPLFADPCFNKLLNYEKSYGYLTFIFEAKIMVFNA